MLKAVIFDLDGTLLNTLDDLADAVNYGLRSCNFPERTVEEVRSFVGNGVRVLIKRSAPDGISTEAYEECFSNFSNYYLEHMRDKTAPYEGIMSLLEKLKADGIKTSVVSNKLHKAVVELCDDYFGKSISCSFGVEKESERKPAPDNVYKALDFLDVEKEEAIYVGDSDVDIQTADNSGLKCVCVSWGFRDRSFLESFGAKIVVDNTEDLYNYIKSLV